MECAVVVLCVLMKLSSLAYANQGEPGLNEHSLNERPLPSSSLSFPVLPNVSRLANSTINGTIKTNSSAVLASSGSTSIIETMTVAQSQTSTMILAPTSISRGDVLTSLPQITTMIVLNQSENTPHGVSSKTQTISISTTSILAHTSIIGASISPSELSGHSSSSMMTRSTDIPTVHVSGTQSMISPTTVHVYSSSVATSVHLSSSVLSLLPSTSPPPGAPDPPVIRDINVLSAHSVLINWNTTTGQIVSNFSVELSVDFVSWKKAMCNGSVEPGDCVITQKQAVIIQLKPYTNYTFRVMARGQFGTSNYSTDSKMVLTDEAAPSTPQNLSAQSVSSTEIQISWKPPTNTNGKIKYRLSFYKTLEPSAVPMLVYDGIATQHLVSKLKPYTHYTFGVAAYNVKYNLSSASVNTSEETHQAAPSGAPLITAADAISSQEFVVAWTPPPPETLNGELQTYEVHVRKTTSVQPTTLPTSKVAATTYTLHGAVSSVILPSAVSLSSSFTSVSSTPKPTTPGGAFTVTKPLEPTQEPEDQRSDQGGSMFWVIDAGLVLNYTVGDLEKWTTYEVKVRAVTVAPGPFSNKVTVRTSEDVPSQPRQVLAKAVNSTAIFVNWTEPAEMNGHLVKYQIKYSAKYSLESVITKDVGQNDSSVLALLNPFTLYVINVSAFTSKGEGSHASVEILTDEGRPSTPQNLSSQSVSSKKIQVSWKPPANSNGKIKYRLSFYKTLKPSNGSMLVYDGNATRQLVSNLKPYTHYTFEVVAYNVKYNLSSASVKTSEKTEEADTWESTNKNVLALTTACSSRETHVNPGIHQVEDEWGAQQDIMETPSGPPRNVRAVTNSSSTIILYWLPPSIDQQNGEITSYRIRMRGSDPSYTVINTRNNLTTLPITGLQAFTNYTFMVQALNNEGVGPLSPRVLNRTFETEPSSPRNVTAKSVSSTAVIITWIKALHPNGIINYKLYKRLSKEDAQKDQVVYQGTGTSYVETELQEYVMYTFTVVSVNIRHRWESKPVVVMETTLPAEPTGAPQDILAWTLSSTSILIKWSPPLPSEQNGVILNYTVSYNRSQSSQLESLDTADNSTSIEVKNLTIFTKYWFRVKAWNVVGPGPESESVYNTTSEDTPSPAVNIVAKTVNSTAIKVTWQAPLYPNGEIYYRLYYWQSIEGAGTKSLAYDGPSLGHTVTGLHEYVTYTFMLQAYNFKYLWTSKAINATVTTHPAEPSGPPLNVKALTRSSTSILVKWSSPSKLDRNGIITHYIVRYSFLDSESSINTTDNATQILVRNLRKFTNYSFTVRAVNEIGVGPPSVDDARNITSEDVPSKPQDLRAWNTSASSIFVTWKKPASINGILKGYQVFSLSAEDTNEPSPKDAGLRTNISLSGLEPYTYYDIAVQALTGAGEGEKSRIRVMTDETAPSPVREVSIPEEKIASYSIEVTWLPPAKLNGKIGYYFFYWVTSDGRATAKRFVIPGSVHDKLVSGLRPFTNYTFSVVPYNLRKNLSGESFEREGQTTATVPGGPPRNVKIESTTSTSFTLTWDPPLEPNGIILGYDVRYYECDESNKKNVHDNIKERTYIIKDLHPYRCYRMHVACKSSGGLGAFSDWVERRTKPGIPPPLGTLAPPDEETIESFSFVVDLTEASNEKGDVRYYQVIVRELATDNRDRPVLAQDPELYEAKDLYTYEEARKEKPQLVPYIAAEFHAKDFSRYQSFVVGDGSRTSKVSEDVLSRRRKREENTIEYYNGPLEENTFYAVFQRAYVNKDIYISSSWIEPVETAAAVSPTEPAGSSTNIGLIVGIVLILLILPIVLAAVYFMWRKRQNSDTVLDDRDEFSNGRPVRMKKMSRKRRSLQKRLMGSTESLGGLEELAASRARRHPVPIDDFERHVDRMHMDGDHGFSEEYLLVQPDEEFSFQQFLNPANKYKNRYANIVAYDHTRVLLNPIEGVPGSDYINSNFIDGYNRQRAYIAAQGPLMETFDDFWRMIWEQMTSIIVMLTKLEERGRRKCDQYWPERGTRNYGQVQVTLKETLNMSHYTVRKLVMTHKMYPDDERVVKQFHFTAWPDHGVPSHPTPLLSLVRHTFSANRESIGPMVVHCSAGVGRTGTFITLDVMLQRISQEDSVDVFGFVRQMRYQRNFMVQTEAQYVFIHDALLEAITCGVTEVEAKDLGARIRELRQVDSETGYTYLENEFCRLAKEENHPIAFKSASLNCNASKNRYANILPFENTRVHLKMRPGEMGSDYINANFIDGYCQPRAYIATQAPVPDTFEDFWRMIWEQESAAVVMLTREEEAGKVKCHHYWPSEGSRLYGVILVELIEEASFGDYISRKFKLTHTEEKDSRTVCQFQYTDWPDTGLPESGVGIVDLIGQVQKWQQQSGNTAIVIHCSGGVGRTGVFCGISMMIERLKAEGVIDVFQTVQAMRLQRPAMVQTAEQYEFCYTTLQEYLDSFDLYANFQ